jgi:hypothetical protein
MRQILAEFSQADKPTDTKFFLAAVRARQDLNEIAVGITQDDFSHCKIQQINQMRNW